MHKTFSHNVVQPCFLACIVCHALLLRPQRCQLRLGPLRAVELAPRSARQLGGVRTQTHNIIKAREEGAGSDISMLQMVAEVLSVMRGMKVGHPKRSRIHDNIPTCSYCDPIVNEGIQLDMQQVCHPLLA
jgi:hypothetical protein